MNGYDNNRPGQPQYNQPQFQGNGYYVPESHRTKSKESKMNTDLMIALVVIGVFTVVVIIFLLVLLVGINLKGNKAENTVPSQPQSSSVSGTGDYLVRESAQDDQSQVGAYDSYNEACNKAKEYKYDGYEVYDNYGNMLFIPEENIVNPSSDQVKYRVRKGSYDSKTQIGAFANYSKALEFVKDRADEGYKIFDMNGNILYDPYTAIR